MKRKVEVNVENQSTLIASEVATSEARVCIYTDKETAASCVFEDNL